MSRSGYSDDCDGLGLWRGAVESAMRGRRGQEFLKELLATLDAMPVKVLVADAFTRDGGFCVLGTVADKRGLDFERLRRMADDEWPRPDLVGKEFGIAGAMAAEIMFMNDEGAYYAETPEKRWARVRAWVASEIRS